MVMWAILYRVMYTELDGAPPSDVAPESTDPVGAP